MTRRTDPIFEVFDANDALRSAVHGTKIVAINSTNE